MPQRSEFSSQPTCLEVLFFLASFLVPRGTGVICSMNRERENAVFKLLVFERNLVRCVPAVSLAKRYIGRHFLSRNSPEKEQRKKMQHSKHIHASWRILKTSRYCHVPGTREPDGGSIKTRGNN